MKPGVKFLHSLFEVTHVEFQTYDLSDPKLLFSSGIAYKLLGYSQEEYLNLSKEYYKTIVHPDDYPSVLAAMDKIYQSKNNEVIEMTVRVRKSDGDYIWLYSRQMIYEKVPGNHICTIIREVEDVTKLVELQNELKERVDQLKTVSFKNSHLLRSPVASIIGLVDLIEDAGVTGDHNRQIFQYLKESIKKLDAVIYEINDVAKLD